MSFVINKGALLPVLQATLLNENGDAVDLSTATSVAFRMRRVGESEALFTSPGTIEDAVSGLVRYTWSGTDTATAGQYEGNFIVTEGGKTQEYPGGDFLPVVIWSDDRSATLVFCTAAQARDLVGQDIDIAELALAQTLLSIRTGVPAVAADFAALDDQDQIGLRQAVAFTAAWLPGQPDYFTRLSVTSESGDGEGRQFSPGALMLPAIVEWCLSNTRFSGREHRTVETPRAGFYDAIELIPYSSDLERTWRNW